MIRRLGRILLASILVGLVGAVCFAVGGRVGFMEGYMVAGQASEILAAHIVLTSLNASSKGDKETARGLLEHSSTARSSPPGRAIASVLSRRSSPSARRI